MIRIAGLSIVTIEEYIEPLTTITTTLTRSQAEIGSFKACPWKSACRLTW